MARFPLLCAAAVLMAGTVHAASPGPWRTAALDRQTLVQLSAADLTIRNAFTTPAITTANGGSSQTVVSWAATDRQKLIVRNPARSPGSIRLMTKTGAQNAAIDTGSVGTLVATLAPGEEWFDTAGQTIYLAQSDDASGSVPANLKLDVYAEYAAPGAALPAASSGKRAITASTYKRHGMTGGTWIGDSAPPFLLSKDGSTFYRRNPANKYQLQQSTDYADNGTSATWTTVTTLPTTTGGTGIIWLIELDNGEVLAGLDQFQKCDVYKSTGWATGHATATFTKVLSSVGGSVALNYSGHQFGAGSDGVVILAETGSQTAGGSGNTTVDATKATRVFVSQDFGATWATAFDIRTFATAQGVSYPAGVHIHGVAYDESWDRLYILYGDATGDGKTIAGTGYAQVVTSDDRGATWSKLPAFQNWLTAPSSSYTGQYIGMTIGAAAITFTPDVGTPPSAFVVRKTEYRQYGAAEVLAGASGGVAGMSSKGPSGYYLPGLANGGTYVSAGTYNAGILSSTDGANWDQMNVTETLTASGAVGALRVLGPTASGKVVAVFAESAASMSGGNVLIGTLAYQ